MSEPAPELPTQLESVLRGGTAALSTTGTVVLTWLDPPRTQDPNAVTWPQRIITVELGTATIITLEPEPGPANDELED